MNIVGVVARYNPFHYGHQYHLSQTKSKSEADAVVVVMSGFFTQRGTPAILSPWQRARTAVAHGADLVLLLPTAFAVNYADRFAQGGVSILNQLPGVGTLSFGAESDCLENLSQLADVLLENAMVQELAKREQKSGGNFGKTMTLALQRHPDFHHLAPLLKSPNNILAIGYLKAIKRYHSSLQPMLIPRSGSGYLEETLQPMASATALRKALIEKQDLLEFLPAESYRVLQEERKQGRLLLSIEAFAPQILTLLQRSTVEDLALLPEMNEGLERRWLAMRDSRSISDFILRVKSKRYPYSKLQRSLLHLLLGMQKSDLPDWEAALPYARVLAFNPVGQKLLSDWRTSSAIPLITQPGKQKYALSPYGQRLLEIDCLAAELWALALPSLEARNSCQWHTQQPLRLAGR